MIADESSQTTQLLSEAPARLADSRAPSYVAAIAHHTYNYPSASQLEQVGALGDVNGKPAWASEICCQVTGGGYGAQYDPTIAGGLALANYIYTDLSYADDSAFDWWTALSSGLGCDPATDSACATTVNSCARAPCATACPARRPGCRRWRSVPAASGRSWRPTRTRPRPR